MQCFVFTEINIGAHDDDDDDIVDFVGFQLIHGIGIVNFNFHYFDGKNVVNNSDEQKLMERYHWIIPRDRF